MRLCRYNYNTASLMLVFGFSLLLRVSLGEAKSGKRLPVQTISVEASSSTPYMPPKVALVVNENGTVSADIKVFRQNASPSSSQYSTPNLVITLSPLPFTLATTGARIISAPDVRISPIIQGQGYVILAIVSPNSLSEIKFHIDNLTTLSETREGKAQLEFDLSYPYMSQAERELLSLPISTFSFDIAIVLPERYDERAISFNPPFLNKEDEKTFSLSATSITQQRVSKTWIVFPSPMRSKLNMAQLIFSLVVGVFTLLFHVNALRERKISWSIGVLVLSVILLTVASYYTYALAKGFEFLTFASAAIPHAIYGFGASTYLLVAKKRQAILGGQINIADKPAEFAEVFLWRLKDGNRVEVDRLDALKPGGRYTFYAWQREHSSRYVVSAKATGAREAESPDVEATKGRRREVPVINLEWIPPAIGRERLEVNP